ncbi:uracil-DNA glycosylase family protein [Marilutibacter aestuarii]|uniref:uracil-DNA glycosylase family protein n=1 Tax=Marilutibacter aestuarii TaxID=1706195 RepID=UPI001FEA85AD|nr:uracil-DNA glycosylase family protein [Lysobacter aestuarii]
MADALPALLCEIRACTQCAAVLPLGPRPVVQASRRARVLVIGQAPGARVHASGIPWDDASGRRLREWLGLDSATFYDADRVALVPMGFCYPGKRSGGDAPPRPECRATWHPRLLPLLANVRLSLLVGRHAQAHVLGTRDAATLTATVRDWRAHLEQNRLPLPHPSPRNVAWFKANPWFEQDVLPGLRLRVRAALGD